MPQVHRGSRLFVLQSVMNDGGRAGLVSSLHAVDLETLDFQEFEDIPVPLPRLDEVRNPDRWDNLNWRIPHGLPKGFTAEQMVVVQPQMQLVVSGHRFSYTSFPHEMEGFIYCGLVDMEAETVRWDCVKRAGREDLEAFCNGSLCASADGCVCLSGSLSGPVLLLASVDGGRNWPIRVEDPWGPFAHPLCIAAARSAYAFVGSHVGEGYELRVWECARSASCLDTIITGALLSRQRKALGLGLWLRGVMPFLFHAMDKTDVAFTWEL